MQAPRCLVNRTGGTCSCVVGVQGCSSGIRRNIPGETLKSQGDLLAQWSRVGGAPLGEIQLFTFELLVFLAGRQNIPPFLTSRTYPIPPYSALAPLPAPETRGRPFGGIPAGVFVTGGAARFAGLPLKHLVRMRREDTESDEDLSETTDLKGSDILRGARSVREGAISVVLSRHLTASRIKYHLLVKLVTRSTK